MAEFSYTAVNSQGKVVSGNVQATDRGAAVKTLAGQKLRPTSVKEASAAKSGGLNRFLGGNKVKSDHIVIFTRELSAMVSAGVPLLRALTSLHDHTESVALKKVLESVIRDVEAGAPLGDALEKFPNTFSSVYVNMVRAGEAAGILDEILKRLAL